MRKGEKAVNERGGAVRRHVDTILRGRFERWVRRRRGVPIELHIHAPGPLDYSVLADRVIEGTHQNIRAVSLRGPNRGIQIGYQVTRPFESERVRHGRFESEDGESSDGRQHQLRHRLARSWSYREDALLGFGSAERGEQAVHELVEVF